MARAAAASLCVNRLASRSDCEHQHQYHPYNQHQYQSQHQTPASWSWCCRPAPTLDLDCRFHFHIRVARVLGSRAPNPSRRVSRLVVSPRRQRPRKPCQGRNPLGSSGPPLGPEHGIPHHTGPTIQSVVLDSHSITKTKLKRETLFLAPADGLRGKVSSTATRFFRSSSKTQRLPSDTDQRPLEPG